MKEKNEGKAEGKGEEKCIKMVNGGRWKVRSMGGIHIGRLGRACYVLKSNIKEFGFK